MTDKELEEYKYLQFFWSECELINEEAQHALLTARYRYETGKVVPENYDDPFVWYKVCKGC